MDTPSIEAPVSLIGRDRELTSLSGLYDGPPARARVVVIHGEAGVGKTRLIEEMTRRARAAGALVVSGRAHRFGADSSPYLPLLSALRDLGSFCGARELPELDGLVASVGAAADAAPGDRTDAFSGRLVREISHVLNRAAEARPTVLIVDDLQWADPTTMEVLAFLADAHESDRLSLVVAYRDEGLPDGHALHTWLVDLRKALPVEVMHLGRLTFDQTAEQVVSLLGSASLAQATDVFARSAGNPYLTELICRSTTRAELEPDDGVGADVESALRSVLLASWHRLSPVAREVARAVSVAGRPGSVDLFGRVMSSLGISTRDSEAAIREGISSGLMTWDSGRDVWFRHPLAAEILESTLMPAERARLHRAFAAELELDPSQSHAHSDRALHVAAAGDARHGFDLCLEAAALELARGSASEAANLHRRAIELWHSIPDDTRPGDISLPGLYADLAELLLGIGNFAAAHDAATRAYNLRDEDSDPVTAGRVITLWLQLRMYSGVKGSRDAALIAHAVELASADPTSAAYVRALGEQAETARFSGDLELAGRLAGEAVAASANCGEATAQALALMARLNVSPTRGDLDALDRLARATGVPEVVSLNCQVRAFPLCNQGDWPACADQLQIGYEAAARSGAIGPEQMLGSYLALFQVGLGRVAEAREVLRLVLASRPSGMYGVLAHTQSLVIALRAGNEARADLHMRWLRELVDAFEDMVGLWGPSVLAEYHLNHGRPETALELLGQRVEEHSVHEPMYGDLMLMWCARAAADICQLARDDRNLAAVDRTLARLEQAVAARNRAPVPAFASPDNPISIAARAAFEADRARCEDADDAVQVLRTAAETAQTAGLRFDAAVATLHEAELLAGRHGRRGGRQEAARRLRQAHSLATDIEAHRLRGQIEATARAARLSLAPPRGATGRTGPSSRSGITPREFEVLSHLAAGDTYAEIADALFISQKTVSTHISNLLGKTDTRGRTDVVAWARRQGLIDN